MDNYDDDSNAEHRSVGMTDDTDVPKPVRPPITQRFKDDSNMDEGNDLPHIMKHADLKDVSDSGDRRETENIVDFDSRPAGLRGNDYPGSGKSTHDEAEVARDEGERDWERSPTANVSDGRRSHPYWSQGQSESTRDDQPSSVDEVGVEAETHGLSDLSSRKPEDHSRHHDDSDEADLYGKSGLENEGEDKDDSLEGTSGNDSKMGKVMEKAGNVLGSETLAEKGHKKREDANYDESNPDNRQPEW